jgi:hypothetical protein
VALVGLIQFRKPLEVTTAQYQLQEIRAAVDSWNSQDIQQQTLQETNVPWGPPMVSPENGKLRNAFLVNGHILVLSGTTSICLRGPDAIQKCVTSDKWVEEVFNKPLSLRSFRDLWDSRPTLLSFDKVDQPQQTIVIAKKDGASNSISINLGELDSSYGSFETPDIAIVGKEQQTISNLLNISAPRFVLSWNAGDANVFLAATIIEHTLSIQPVLIHAHPYWKPGSFSEVFSDLDKATQPFQGNSFEAISSKLQEEAQKPKADSFEVFGVKFPVEKATRWGILLIVGIQLYLWIHLHELSPRLKEGDEGWDVAWIGVYRSLPARILFICSTAVLPIATIVALGSNALRGASSLVWAVYVLALLVSLLLAYLIVRTVPRLGGKQIGAAIRTSKLAQRHEL